MFGGFPNGLDIKNLPVIQKTQETWGWSMGWEDSLVEGMAAHSSIPAWGISWTEEPHRLQSIGHTKSDMPEAT